jgi:hypothetical protein
MAQTPLPLDKKPYYNTDAIAESISSDDMIDCYMEAVPGIGLITRRRPGLVNFANLDSGMTAADIDGYLVAETGEGPWLVMAGQPNDIWGHKVTIASTADLSAIHFTLVGTDVEGLPLTETGLHGPNNGSVSSASYFKSLTSVTADATLGVETMNVGWAAALDIAGDGIFFWEPMNKVIVVNNGKIFNVTSAGVYTPLTRLHNAENLIGHIESATDEDIILFDRTHAPDNLCHQVTLTSLMNLSGLTITITGLDADGNEQEETLVGPDGT